MAERKKTKAATPQRKRRKARPRAPIPPPRTIPVTEAMSEAFGEISSLAEEMREWHDNMEANFSHTQKYEDVGTAADTLENAQEPSDNYDALKEITVTIQDPRPTSRGLSRAARLADAVNLLQQCVQILEDTKDDDTKTQAVRDGAETLHGEIESVISDIEYVDFPGMYG